MKRNKKAQEAYTSVLCHIPTRASITSRARLNRSMILSALGPNHALTNFLVGYPSWDCSRINSLNFGVPMEPEASELPKGLVLGRDENVHIKLRGSTSLDDNFSVGHPSWECSRTNSLKFGVPMEPEANELPKGLVLGLHDPLLWVMWDLIIHPLKGTTSLSAHFRPWIGYDTKLSHPDPGLHHNSGSTPSTILSALSPGHALTVLFLGTHEQLPKPETNELPKGFVLIGGVNVHIRLTGSTPTSDVGSYT
ncbi:hypothetical protein DVH24_033578 [Malus domestica]|uniref:Uncharacterized protein n=1 Tax=Malus domestica TaxID=3750 RepID=A0A498JG16_MALDO|nr:hypothetical protein DVH24_033578 [Malus domestica]